MTIDGRRRTITKREAIVTQMVDKSAGADLCATKIPIDMMKDVERKAGAAALILVLACPTRGGGLGEPTRG